MVNHKTGEWIKGPGRPHQCVRPDPTDAWAGSVWRCGCGRAWVVVDGTPREPGNYWMRDKINDAVPGAE